MRIFKGLFKESETKWIEILCRIIKQVKKIKNERDLLLAKFFNKDETTTITSNFEITRDNLIAHKQLIERIVGQYYNEESERHIAIIQRDSLEKEIKKWIPCWDQIKIDDELKVYLLFYV